MGTPSIILYRATTTLLTVVLTWVDLSLSLAAGAWAVCSFPLRCARCVVGVATRSIRPTRKKHVVIVGGSFAGLVAQRELAEHGDLFDVTVVDTKEYFEYTPGALRCFVEPSHFAALSRPIPRASNAFKRGRVVAVRDGRVEVELPGAATGGGLPRQGVVEEIDFDFLVFATGSTYGIGGGSGDGGSDGSSPAAQITATQGTMAERAASWHKAASGVAAARRILVLGGGAVGTELAAELVERFPHKEITLLVTREESLLASFPRATQTYVQAWLRRRGVNVLFAGRVASVNDTSCVLESGETVEADLIFTCFGASPNSEPVHRHDPEAARLGGRANGGALPSVSVDTHLEAIDPLSVVVSGGDVGAGDIGGGGSVCGGGGGARVGGGEEDRLPNVFAAGDVMTHPNDEGEKQAFFAETSGHVAAANILRRARGQPLLAYPDGWAGEGQELPFVYVVSLGKYDGSLGFNGIVVNGVLAAVVKWVLEWTKVRQMHESRMGVLIWQFGDAVTGFLSRYVVPPTPSAAKTQAKKNEYRSLPGAVDAGMRS